MQALLARQDVVEVAVTLETLKHDVRILVRGRCEKDQLIMLAQGFEGLYEVGSLFDVDLN